jgi:multiple sugar transport system substrate-binding protein
VKLHLTGILIATAALAAACGGGGATDAKQAAQARGPIKLWYSNNQEEVTWGKAMVTAWNAAHPNEKVTASSRQRSGSSS